MKGATANEIKEIGNQKKIIITSKKKRFQLDKLARSGSINIHPIVKPTAR
ncbi:hypothetical protein [Scopulibacillus cellulosilyticus]|uniref:Uncharacterized protein n=1 Tax=Scopulibacillus cellulosilyticus TaxID=2665665 RepID=A0ABW2PVZ1_9BACL